MKHEALVSARVSLQWFFYLLNLFVCSIAQHVMSLRKVSFMTSVKVAENLMKSRENFIKSEYFAGL